MDTKEISNNRKIAKNTMFLYIRLLVSMLISLYTSRIVLDSLGVENYGIYGVVGSVVSMFSIISSSLSSTISRFITYELGDTDNYRLNRLFCTTVNIQFILAFIIFIIAEIAGIWFINNKMVLPEERIFAATIALHCSLAAFCINLISVPYNACIIAHEKMSAFAYISIYEVFARLLICYLLYICLYDRLIVYALLQLLIQISVRLIYGVYCKRNFGECTYRFVFEKGIFYRVINFAGWSSISLVADICNNTGLNIMLNVFFGPIVNAAYTIMNQVKNAIQNFTRNFQVAINPQIIKSYAEGNIDRCVFLIFTGTKFSYYLAYVLILPVFFQIDNILGLWLLEVPAHTSSFIRIILCATLMYTIGDSLFTATQASGKIKKYQLVTGPLMLLVMPISYLSCKIGGNPEAIFMIFIGMLFIVTILCIRIVLSDLDVPIKKYWNNVLSYILKVTIISLILPFIFHFNITNSNVLYTIAEILICVFSVIVSIYAVGLTKSERHFLISKIKSFIK